MFVALTHFFAFMVNVINVLYVIVYAGCLKICNLCYIWRNRLYVKGVRPRPLTCGKGGELKQINHELRVFDPGRLLMVRVGNLNKLTTS